MLVRLDSLIHFYDSSLKNKQYNLNNSKINSPKSEQKLFSLGSYQNNLQHFRK